jgi:hypothetical protein
MAAGRSTTTLPHDAFHALIPASRPLQPRDRIKERTVHSTGRKHTQGVEEEEEEDLYSRGLFQSRAPMHAGATKKRDGLAAQNL